MATAAAANGTGIVFLVDEMQLLGRGDLEALCAAAHRAIPSRPVRFEQAAVDAILALSERYPCFLQAYGLGAWDAAPEGELIRARDVERAAGPTRAELDRDFFETRFARATEAGRRYLAAMVALGDGPCPSAEAARRGGWRSGASAGPVRQTLIEKGLIYSPERGLVAFTVPHFAEFMRRKQPVVANA